MQGVQVEPEVARVVLTGQTQVELTMVNVLSLQMHGLPRRFKLFWQVWHTLVLEQVKQLFTLHVTQLPLFRVVPAAQTQKPFVKVNVLGHPQVLLVVFNVKFPAQVWHTFTEEQLTQLVGLQLIQVVPESENPEVQTQFPPTILNVASGQEQVLLALRVKFPVQFWQTLDELQVKQLFTLHAIQFPLYRVVPAAHTQVLLLANV